jgi:hypothetical protein
MATSRGVILAIVSGVGAWLLWRLTQAEEIKRRFKSEAAFPILLVVYLCIVGARIAPFSRGMSTILLLRAR